MQSDSFCMRLFFLCGSQNLTRLSGLFDEVFGPSLLETSHLILVSNSPEDDYKFRAVETL